MLVYAATKQFGSWKAAIQAAGFDYREIRANREWTEDEVGNHIRSLVRKGGNPVSTEVKRIDSALHKAGIQLFGSWKSAVKAAGFTDYESFFRIERWNREKVIEALHKRISEGKSTSYRLITKEDSKLASAVYRYFDSHPKAVRAAKRMRSDL